MNSRLSWFTEQVPEQPRLHREALSQTNKQTNKQWAFVHMCVFAVMLIYMCLQVHLVHMGVGSQNRCQLSSSIALHFIHQVKAPQLSPELHDWATCIV